MGVPVKKVILCADDFALNTAISHGIVQLISSQRISATSCMVRSSYWQEHAELLKPHQNQIDIGLHFYLPQMPNLLEVILKTNLKLINKNIIASEFEKQLAIFEQTLGRLPDFIDGHRHIHQLPVISDIIINACQKQSIPNKIYVRNATNSKFFSAKQLVVSAVSDLSFEKKLRDHEIPYNTSFAGIYNFNDSYRYYQYFPKFLKAIGDKGLIMCHPALNHLENRDDPMADSRYDEFQYFSSSQFIQDCQEQQVVISRFHSNN